MQVYQNLYQKTLLALLGVTKAISSTERSIPGKWHNVIDSVRVSSQTAHIKLIEADPETAKEFYNWEKDFKRKIGKEKLYTQDDIREAKKRINRVEF